MAVVEAAMVGFCEVDVNAFGPLQEYDVPPEDERLIVAPAQ